MKKLVSLIIISLLVLPSLLAYTVSAAAPAATPMTKFKTAAAPQGTWVLIDRKESSQTNDVNKDGYTNAIFSKNSVTVMAGRNSENAAKYIGAWSNPPAALSAGQVWTGSVSLNDMGSKWDDDYIAQITFTANSSDGGSIPVYTPGKLTTNLKGAQVVITKPGGELSKKWSGIPNTPAFEWKMPTADDFSSPIIITATVDVGAGINMRATVKYTYELQLVAQPAPASIPQADSAPEYQESQVFFSSLKGQIEILPPGANPRNGWRLVKLGTPIAVGAHIRTFEDASATLSWSDRSTFIMKPETTIEILPMPEAPSKLGLLTGKIWANLKQMATEGTMEVDMNQAVCGIKGTTLVLEEDGTQSTVKVIEGQVSFTSKANGQTQLVNTGQTTTATSSGLTPVTTFDAAAEQAAWDAVRAETESGEAATAASGSNLPIVPIIIGVVVVIVLIILAVVTRSMKKKPARG